LLPINGLFVIVIDIAGSILASRLLVNRDIKLRKKPGDDAEALGFFFSVVLLNFDSSSLALLVIGATDGVEKMYDVHPEIGMTYSGFNIVDGQDNTKVKNHPKARLIKNQFTAEGQREFCNEN
jgi:hypothetical protein